MKKNTKQIAGKMGMAVLTGAWKFVLFMFWVCGSAVVVLLKSLLENIRSYLFDRE